MENFINENNQIPVIADVDVCVCGAIIGVIVENKSGPALSVKQNVKLPQLDVKEIQKHLGE